MVVLDAVGLASRGPESLPWAAFASPQSQALWTEVLLTLSLPESLCSEVLEPSRQALTNLQPSQQLASSLQSWGSRTPALRSGRLLWSRSPASDDYSDWS
jgi:hypothetical protein